MEKVLKLIGKAACEHGPMTGRYLPAKRYLKASDDKVTEGLTLI